jgi:hypothetical protein
MIRKTGTRQGSPEARTLKERYKVL